VGTWGAGPFENDAAMDFIASLRDADPADRVGILSSSLVLALEQSDYLDADDGAAAVAAAAVVAMTRSGSGGMDSGPLVDLLQIGSLELPADLLPLARRALGRVVADNSELRDLWGESGSLDDDFAREIQKVKQALA
jgi:hypothetical protein